MYGKRKCTVCKHNPENKIGFVQWYKTLDNNVWQVVKIDALLNCIRLRWQRPPGEKNVFSARKELELVLLESTRAVVQIDSKISSFHAVDYDDRYRTNENRKS